jgi:uncharacterized Fe-S center protein
MVNAALVANGSYLEEKVCECEEHNHDESDKIKHIHPNTDWRVSLNYGEQIGLGTQEYELIVVK